MGAVLHQEKPYNPMLGVVRKATLDPDWFASNILGMPNDPWQSELLNAIADLDRIRLGIPTLYNPEGLRRFSIRSCHGTGKTHAMAKVMHWFNFTRRGRIPCTAPKEKQLVTRLWPEFRKVRMNAIPEYRALIKSNKTSIEWCGDEDWTALIEAASQPENLAGYHDDHLLFLVDEASGVDEQMFPVIEGALSTENAIFVMISNPTKTEGEFYNSHAKVGTAEFYYSMHVGPEDSPHVSEKWVSDMRKKYGAKSPIFLVRCLGEFAEMSENQLLAMAWIESARAKVLKQDGSLPKIRISADIADGGLDETVITYAIHYDSFTYFKKQWRYSFPASEAPIMAAEAVERIIEASKFRKDRDDIVVDAMGVGSGTAGYLIKKGYRVVTYKGGESSDDVKQWRNRRTQSYLVFRDALRDGTIIFSDEFFDDVKDWDDFLGQATSIKSLPGTERVEEIETKKSLTSRGIKSPDMIDSAVMQYATQLPAIASMPGTEPVVIGTMETAEDGW